MLPSRSRAAVCLVLALLAPAATRGDDKPFALKNGDRVVFYGDSITDQRIYTTFVETYVVTRFPKMTVDFVHSGWGGDRVTGGGGGRVGRRLRRDVYAYNPTVVTIMLGMNDGSYRAFDQGIFDTYSRGYTSLVQDIKDEIPGVRLTLIQPSPFDDVTRPPNFEGGYNEVLVKYGEFLKDLAQKEGVDTADLNTSVVAALKKAFEADPDTAKKIIQDRVHPGPAGQLLMAAALLKAWNAPAVVSEAEFDARGQFPQLIQSTNTTISDMPAASKGDKAVRWRQLDRALPMPIDLKDPVMALAVRSSDVVESLDQQTVKVSGLKDATYRLAIDGGEVGTYTKEQLAEGVNIATANTPMARQAAQVHDLTRKHTDIHNLRWRQVQVPLRGSNTSHLDAALKALDDLESDLVAQQRQAAQPRPHDFELAPVE
jgi:lysophospholipase L1-like esterase